MKINTYHSKITKNKISETKKNQINWNKLPFPPIFDLCWCGCGQIVYGRKRYKRGHHNYLEKYKKLNSKLHEGKYHTIETKLKLSIINKGKHCGDLNPSKRPEVRIKQSLALKGKPKSEEHIKKNIESYRTMEYKKKMSGQNNPRYGKMPPNSSGYGKGDYYESPLQGKIWLRSTYELAYAKYLDSQKILWYYEIETFDLENDTYTPDFFLPKFEKFVEIKGYLYPKAKVKINKFKEEYPFDLEILYKDDLIKLGIDLK